MPDFEWFHIKDGSLCVAGHDSDGMCAEGGGAVDVRLPINPLKVDPS